MKRLDLILNGKGGVGKSFFAVNFVQYLKDKGIAHVAIDSDNENSTLKRFHPDARFVDLAATTTAQQTGRGRGLVKARPFYLKILFIHTAPFYVRI